MTNRIVPCLGTVAVVAQLFLSLGCGGSNGPATTTGNGGTTGAAGTTGAGTAGTTGSTGTAGTTGSTGTAGTTGSTGTGGTTGSTGTAGTSGTFGTPICGNTSGGTPIAKTVACGAADTQLCYKTCGPNGAMGVKSETCSGGAYMEMSGCSFPPGVSQSCYSIPATQDATCPDATAAPMGPMASAACTVAACTVCSGPGTSYLDSTGAAKQGYCVCVGATGAGKWSCASTTAWPCAPGVACP
jgi:hypothetical protein